MRALSRDSEDLDRIRKQVGKRLKIELTEKCVNEAGSIRISAIFE